MKFKRRIEGRESTDTVCRTEERPSGKEATVLRGEPMRIRSRLRCAEFLSSVTNIVDENEFAEVLKL